MYNSLVPVTLKRAALIGALLLAPMFAGAQNSDSKAITDLLKQAKEHAVLAEEDAITIESYTLSSVSWQSHGNRLDHMREHATDLIDEFNHLNALREQGSVWQREAIDHVNPLLHEMADHLTATINHFTENKSRVNMSSYRDYAKANHDLMSQTSRLISDFVDYGKAKSRADLLEKTLDLPVTARDNQ